MKQITNIIKSKKHIWLRTKEVKTDVNETKHANKPIGNVNKTIQSIIISMNRKKLESINVTIAFKKEADKDKETSSAYDNKGEEKISRKPEKT